MSIIDNLPNLPNAPTTGDEIPVERGVVAYKLDYNALANAIISKLGGDPITAAHGGSGLSASPQILVNLASTSAVNVMQASPRPGVTGTLPIPKGGTGATTAAAALTNLGISPTDISGSWTVTSNTANGLTTELWVSSIIPRLVKIRVKDSTSVTLATASDYVTLWSNNSTIASLASYVMISCEMFTSKYAGQLKVQSNGTIQIGYTLNLYTNTYEDIPSGTAFYFEKTILIV